MAPFWRAPLQVTPFSLIRVIRVSSPFLNNPLPSIVAGFPVCLGVAAGLFRC